MVALRIMGSGFAAVTFKNNQQAEAAYKQEEQEAAPVFMAEYRQPVLGSVSYLEWRLLQPGTAVRFAAQSDGIGQYAVAERVDAAAGGGSSSKVGFGLDAKGALGFVNPERMLLLEAGGAAQPPAKGGAKGVGGHMPVVTVSRQKAVSSQIAQVNRVRASFLVAPHLTPRRCSGDERASSFFKKTAEEEEEEEEEAAVDQRQQNLLRTTRPRCRPRPPSLRRRRREVDGGSALQATGRRTGPVRLRCTPRGGACIAASCGVM